MGEIAALTASLCWAIASVLFTRLQGELGPRPLNLTKCAIALGMTALTRLVLVGPGRFSGIDGGDVAVLLVSGAIGLAIGDTFLFEAFDRIGPRRTLLLSTLTPPFTALLAWPALGEALTTAMVLGMALTLAGVGWVVSERTDPDGTPSPPGTSRRVWSGIGWAAAWAFLQAVANVLTKVGGGEAAPLDVTVIRLAAGTAVLLAIVGLRDGLGAVLRPLTTRPGLARRVTTATVVGTYLGVWLQIYGLRYTSHAGVAATLSSTAPLFVLPLAATFLDDRPTTRAVAGAAIAVVGIAVLVG